MATVTGRLVAPNGKCIIGTVDILPACALVASWERDESGAFEPNWEGSTTVFWDGQETLSRDDVMLVQDDEGNEYPIDQCAFVPGECE